jgi:hypothetical protein
MQTAQERQFRNDPKVQFREFRKVTYSVALDPGTSFSGGLFFTLCIYGENSAQKLIWGAHRIHPIVFAVSSVSP